MIENQNVNKKDEKIQSGYEQLENFDKENNDNNNYEEIKEENNEELNKENPFNQVQKSIIEQRNIIQSQLKFICNKIEDALNTYHIKKLEKEREKEEMNKTGYTQKEIKPVTKEINNYKEQTKKIQDELDNVYNNLNIHQIENDIKEKRILLKEIKKDNLLLKKATKGQEKDINEFNNKNYQIDEIEDLKEKIKKSKDALKITKDFYKEQELKLKEQQTQIDNLDKKKRMIKDNIEFQKKKKIKNEKNKKENEKEEKEKEKGENNYEKEDIYTLDDIKLKLAVEIDNEEKKYKEELNNQKILIESFSKDIEILKIKLKSIEQTKRMDELKKKEAQKIKLKEIKQKKLQNQMMNNNNMIKIYQNKKRGYSRDNVNRRFNNLNNFNNNTNNNSQWPELSTLNNKKRNFNQFRENKNDKKFSKPFEINKFFQNNNITERRPHTQLGNLNDRKKKFSTLNQIEQLKFDIQKALNNNAHLFDNNIINNNNNQVINNNKGFDKNNEPSTIIGNNVNNDISDIKNDIEYLNELDVGNLDKFSMKQTGDLKRKPFEKINFK